MILGLKKILGSIKVLGQKKFLGLKKVLGFEEKNLGLETSFLTEFVANKGSFG